MKKQIYPNIWVADMEGCTMRLPINGDRAAFRVHACKHPCHHGMVGDPPASDKHYLTYEKDDEVYMNLIDAKLPYFQRASFDHFLRKAREHWMLGRPLLIHCNQGASRAPTLALLFMAKCIKVLSDASYDDAWDDFEKKCGPYTPSAGIEQWVRENWASIQDRPAAYIAGVANPYRFTHYQAPDTSRITNEEAVSLVQGSPIVHFSTMVTIEDKKHEQVVPKPNILQMRFDEAYQIFRQRGIPIRIMALKPRQVGCSTIAGHLCYHHARNCKVDGLIIGDEGSRTMKVWQIFTEYAQNDSFPWNSEFRHDTKKAIFEYPDGTEGRWESDTANDPKAGISGTRQVIWYTEAARYARTGSRTDVKVITASLNSLAKVPNSMAIMESTADGANGFFYDNWQGAVPLEDFRKGKYGNGWVQIFAAWFEFVEHTIDRTAENEGYFKSELGAREKRGVSLYGWDAKQIAWRRKTIETDCAGDERIFDQDFPEDDRSCIEGSIRVGTQRGIIPIRDIKIGDILESGIVTNKRLTGIRPVVRLETHQGHNLICTPDHPIATHEGDFKRADECLGQSIRLSAPLFAESEYVHQWKQFGCVQCSIRVTETWGRFLGYYMGDGSFFHQSVDICCDRKDMDVVEDVARCMRELFGEPSIKIGHGGNCMIVKLSRSRFDDLFEGLGLVKENVSSNNSKFKRRIHVPEIIWRSPKHIVREFLSALFESDGWQSKTRSNIKFFAKDFTFCSEVQHLLLGFGIRSALHRVKKIAKGKEYEGCELVLHSLYAPKFVDRIGFISARKRTPPARVVTGKSGRRPVDYGMSDTVVSVVPHGEAEVFDIEIDEKPWFDAGGFLVHNCFLSSGRPRFNDDGVTRLEMMAQNEHGLAELGVLETDGSKVDFIKRTDDPWIWMCERPIMGCSYIAFIDPCMGEQSRGARNPDAHAAGILRASYMDKDEMFHPVELVAVIDVPTGCRWDDSLIAQRLVMLANYYGGCMIVPETGNGLGVLIKLRDNGANIYQRHKEDSIIPGKRVPVSGWETTSSTRDIWVGAMADAIRDQEKSFNCRYLPAVKEMRTFIVDDRGKAQAKASAHDDWIAGIGIGLACIRFAGSYYPPTYRERKREEAQKKVAFSY